ncbi:uncharacterized protein F5891DRAFT_1197479 [Suillus fuscotomentosus]|uniref:Uncharacterized protein n=1 Tax=Suillus fuscotomentosus TaxID=1912939 RepID=A0AAD4DRG9_9AGAM|nr:uncharacterized protein F5891DRAFT_1197479 [Suillus fuscotomentosus]KAG1891715.1 hypothetical protein F5891DRAFT_1197479 [Suillus fuscotomentosus]
MSTHPSPDPFQPMTMSPSSSVQHSPPVDLRRMTSNSTLLTPQKDSIREHRLSTHTSQHLNTTRMGSRSPSSIPSSPTSAHSSSSAIFERDIEPMHPPSPPSHPNPHRIARAKGTEQLEHSVPSVLDSAASILAASSPMEEDHISVVSPSRDRDRLTTSGFASPIGSLRSRSPSPSGRTSLLLSIPSQQGPITPLNITPGVGAGSPQRLSIQTSPLAFPSKQGTSGKASAAPSISTPASVYYSTLSSVEPSPTTTTAEHPSSALPPIAISTLSPSSTYTSSPYIRPITISHPPSPTHGPTKRLSFMSYADLLASTPASMVPLSSFTTCATPEPPPHIPGVEGYALNQHDAASLSGRERDSIAMLDDIGGEWQREGLGRGLEERLEALMIVPSKA